VLAGALIGNTVGRLVVPHRDQLQRSNVSLAPAAGPNFTGLVLGVDF